MCPALAARGEPRPYRTLAAPRRPGLRWDPVRGSEIRSTEQAARDGGSSPGSTPPTALAPTPLAPTALAQDAGEPARRGPGRLGPFERARELAVEAPPLRLHRARQRLEQPVLADLAAAVAEAIAPLLPRIAPGARVAVTAGSRGIAGIVEILAALGELLRSVGAEPFVVTAMGAHGGATEEGQRAVLAGLGVTEGAVRMRLAASMETIEVGQIPGGPRLHVAADAARADAILLVNRVKPHTDFHGPIESGLAKLLAIGLGRRSGAEEIHSFGPEALARFVPAGAAELVARLPVLGGLAILEGPRHRPARLAFVEPGGIGGPAEAALLDEARALLGRLPFDELDVLVVEEIGKDYSGTGMDPNVLGRMRIEGTPEPERPALAVVVALGLSPASGGNGTGLGLADLTTFHALEALDLATTYTNVLTAGRAGIRRAAIPVALRTDRAAIGAAVAICGRPDPAGVRLAVVHDTLAVEDLWISESLVDEARARGLEVAGSSVPLAFDPDGTLALRLPLEH